MKKLTIFICTSLFFFTSCKKDTTTADKKLALEMLSDKIWYLNYSQTISTKGITTKTYLGQSTYYVKFLKNLTTVDSDGLDGTFTIEKLNGILQIHVQGNTIGLNTIEYIYNIETIGANNMILYYTNTGNTFKYFYNSSR